MKIFPEILAGSNFIRNFASAFEKQTKHNKTGAVVQLVRIRACHARGRGFEPLPHRPSASHENEGHLSYMGVCGSAGQ